MRKTMSGGKRITAIGLTAGVLGGGAIGLMLGVPALTSAAVVEQEATPTDDASANDTTVTTDASADDTTTDASTTDDTTTDDTSRPDPGVRLREQLQQLVDDGTITSEQADKVAAFLVENRPEHGPGGFPGGPGGPGWGHGGFGLERGEIAELFGIESDELRQLLRDGQSLADIATAHGVDVQTVIDTLVNASKEHLDEAVTDGRLTQEEADAKLVELTERITEMVNTARPAAD